MKKLSSSFATGAIALVFAVLGYQTALLVHRSAVAKIVADRDRPDTVFVYDSARRSADAGRPAALSSHKGRGTDNRRVNSSHSTAAERLYVKASGRRVENFRFDPNTCSVADLVRLGFSPKQAQSIENYRLKGGRFRRKEDFARSYVVSDSVYARLEAYIDIPRTDLNKADSAAFDALPGIGGWYARKMLDYRERLGGYSFAEQLMDIKGFDPDRFSALSDLICVSDPEPFRLWSLPADSLRTHPYISGIERARSIVFYREHNPREKWTVQGLADAGILTRTEAAKLSRCRLEEP